MKKVVFVISLFFLAIYGLAPRIVHSQDIDGIQAWVPEKPDYVLFVEVKVKLESILDFKVALLSIVDTTRAEDGNLAYFVHQSPDDPTDFMVYEHWRSDEDHARHLQNPSFVNYSKTVAPMMEDGYPIRKKMIELD